MTKKEVKKAAKESILDGKSKQETFETLKTTCDLPTEDLAKIIQSIPSLVARHKYKLLNFVLMALLSLTVFLKMMSGIPLIMDHGLRSLPLLLILPLINIVLLIGVATYSPGSHKWVAIFTILGLIRSFNDIREQPFEPMTIISLIIMAGLIGLGFYLHAKLYPEFLTVKERYQNNQGQDRLRNVIKFND